MHDLQDILIGGAVAVVVCAPSHASAQDAASLPAGLNRTVLCEDGKPVVALNGGPAHKLSPAMSLVIGCQSQEEIDYYWTRLGDGSRDTARFTGHR